MKNMLRKTGEESTYHTAACAKIWEVIFLNYQSDPVVLIHAIIPSSQRMPYASCGHLCMNKDVVQSVQSVSKQTT